MMRKNVSVKMKVMLSLAKLASLYYIKSKRDEAVMIEWSLQFGYL